jgi:hypothetical protein
MRAKDRSSPLSIFVVLNGVLLAALLAALVVDQLWLPRGLFTDYFCDLFPAFVPPLAALLFGYGLLHMRQYGFWILAPVATLGLSLLFRGTIIFWLLGGWTPGQ